MSIRIFHPFQKVWTPRTPDSGYDSLGPPPPAAIIFPNLIIEGIGSGTIFESGQYSTPIAKRGSGEATGYGIVLHSGTYTP
jgi:hypothetical protein